jgi:hypothetical protein
MLILIDDVDHGVTTRSATPLERLVVRGEGAFPPGVRGS